MQTERSQCERLTEREIVPLTKAALDQGRTKQQVFEELAPRFYSREHLAQLISTVPEVELRRTHARTNQVLITMMIATGASHLGLLLLAVLAKGFSPFMLGDQVIPLLPLFFVHRVRRVDPGGYGLAGGLSLLGILDAVRLVRISPLWAFADIALFTTTAILAFYLRGHLFPNRGWTEPRKDENGNYLL